MAIAEAADPEHRKIVLRVGVNLGDVIIEGGDLYGDGVNLAARLQALAGPGEVWVAGSVHDQVEKKIGVGFDDLGVQQVKNIERPVRVFRVAAISSEALPSGVLSPPTSKRMSVASWASSTCSKGALRNRETASGSAPS